MKQKFLRYLLRFRRQINSLSVSRCLRPYIIKYRVGLTVLLLMSVVFLPAFTADSEGRDNMLTRYELALSIESVLDSCKILAQPSQLPVYSDMSSDNTFSIYRVISCKIMQGFADNTFRPEEPLRNVETLAYLQNLSEFLRSNNLHSYASRQLLRLLAYRSSNKALLIKTGIEGSFRGNPFDFTEKKDMYDLLQCLTGQIRADSPVLSGRIINSVTGLAISGACVANGGNAVIADKNGAFSLPYPADAEDMTIFAAADGYKALELNKNVKLGREILLRLNPVSGSNSHSARVHSLL